MMKLKVLPDQIVGRRDEKIYGHFIEHFHRILYGGIYDPQSPFADESGVRKDVIEALRKIKVPVIRWPGGCFVSCYDWKKGIGKDRTPYFDKAWRVEEPNVFGTDEFLDLTAEIGAEPYICANAGTGTPEEISDWVEYCNLENEGVWAKKRIANGHKEPYKVRYWSIGNENYGDWEIGAKSPGEWGRYVKEAAKMIKRVDPSVEVLAANVMDLDWNIKLLKEAGDMIDWISIHGYWDAIHQVNEPSSYEACIARIPEIERQILEAESYLRIFGYHNRIGIAFDEWNLRGWHHPNIHKGSAVRREDYLPQRDLNDINATYTMTDAVFGASFLNCCLRHCNTVRMANFAPSVNVRGAIFTHQNGIVLRPVYHVFDLFVNYMGEQVLSAYCPSETSAGVLDYAATLCEDGSLAVSLVNLRPNIQLELEIALPGFEAETALLYSLEGASKDSYNDIGKEQNVTILPEKPVVPKKGLICPVLAPHSVNVIKIKPCAR